MARNPKQDANLKPYKKGELSSEEAKRRGQAGAKKSAEVRREKRDARQAARYILGLAAKGATLDQLERLGADRKDGLTNMELLMAMLYAQSTSSSSNNQLDATKMLLSYTGYDYEENRRERESLNKDARLDIETNMKRDALTTRGLEDGTVAVGLGAEEGGANDVFIYLPKIDDDPDEEEEAEELEEKDGSKEAEITNDEEQ